MPTLYRTLGSDETKGKFLWFTGENWIFGMGALVIGIFILAQVQHYPWHFGTKVGLSVLPLVIVSAWCILLRQGKPPANDIDLLEDILDTEKIWSPSAEIPKHPLGLNSAAPEEKQ